MNPLLNHDFKDYKRERSEDYGDLAKRLTNSSFVSCDSLDKVHSGIGVHILYHEQKPYGKSGTNYSNSYGKKGSTLSSRRIYNWDLARQRIVDLYGENLRRGEHIVIWQEESESVFGKSIERANSGKINLATEVIPDLKNTATIPWHLAKLDYSSRVSAKKGRKYVEIWIGH